MTHSYKIMAPSGEVVQLGFLLLCSQVPQAKVQSGQGQHQATGLWCKFQSMTSVKPLRKKWRLEAFACDSAVSHFFTGYTNVSVIIDRATLALGSTSQWINTSSPSWRDWLEDYRADQEHWQQPFCEMGRWQRNQNKACFPTCIYHRGHQCTLSLAFAWLVTCIKT